MLPGTGSTAHLNIRSAAQNVTSPSTGDKWTGTRHTLDFAGVGLDVVQQPTGMNFYYGGNGGIQLTPRRNSSVATVVPGWSWYWVSGYDQSLSTLSLEIKVKLTYEHSQTPSLASTAPSPSTTPPSLSTPPNHSPSSSANGAISGRPVLGTTPPGRTLKPERCSLVGPSSQTCRAWATPALRLCSTPVDCMR